MVSQFPLDYMHLVLLGVMRKLILTWMKGPLKVRIGIRCVNDISNRLLAYKVYCPTELARKPRSLSEISHWKATEFRSFLCYTGAVACRGVLHDDVYKNFLLLVCGMRILLNAELCRNRHAFADQLLKAFVQHACKLYGKEIMTYNMHCIIHLAAEGQLFGNLDNISSFPFENYLYQLKKLSRKPGATLQQVVHRTVEQQDLEEDIAAQDKDNKMSFIKQHYDGPIPETYGDCDQFETTVLDGVRFSRKKRDCCIKIGNDFGLIMNVLRRGEHVLAVVKLFKTISCFFDYPAPSTCVGIQKVSQLSRKLHVKSLRDCNKCMLLPLSKDSFVAVVLNSQM